MSRYLRNLPVTFNNHLIKDRRRALYQCCNYDSYRPISSESRCFFTFCQIIADNSKIKFIYSFLLQKNLNEVPAGRTMSNNQYCESGMFILDPGSECFPSRFRILSIPDPGSTSKNSGILAQKLFPSYGLFIPDPDFLPISDLLSKIFDIIKVALLIYCIFVPSKYSSTVPERSTFHFKYRRTNAA